jgi:hypothetical protein
MGDFFSNVAIGAVLAYGAVMYFRTSSNNLPLPTGSPSGSAVFANAQDTINTEMSILSNDCNISGGGSCDRVFSQYDAKIGYGQLW